MIPDTGPGLLWDPHLAADPTLLRPVLLIALVAITIALPFTLFSLLESSLTGSVVGLIGLAIAVSAPFAGGLSLVVYLTEGGGWIDGTGVACGLIGGLVVSSSLGSAVRNRR